MPLRGTSDTPLRVIYNKNIIIRPISDYLYSSDQLQDIVDARTVP